MSELKNKFTMAQPSKVEMLDADAVPENMTIIYLPGHSMDQVGFLTGDGAAYIADSLAASSTIAKYGMTFLYDAGRYLETLENLKHIEAEIFIPAHAPVLRDIAPLADENIKSVKETGEMVWDMCREPITMDELLKKIFDRLGLGMSILQYALLGNTARSYLTWLKESGRAEILIEDNRLLWKSI